MLVGVPADDDGIALIKKMRGKAGTMQTSSDPHGMVWVSAEGGFDPGFLLRLRMWPRTVNISGNEVVNQRPYGRWIDCLPNRTWSPC